MSEIKELDIIEMVEPSKGLKAGDRATVISVLSGGVAFDVETVDEELFYSIPCKSVKLYRSKE